MLTRMNRIWTIVAAAAILTTGLASCLKSGDSTPQQPYAILAMLNGAMYPASTDIYLDGKKINELPFTFSKFALTRITTGSHEVGFKKNASDSSLATNMQTYDTLAWHTLVLYNENITGVDSSFKIYNLKENYTGVSSDKVNFRFFNLSPDAGPVKVFINGEEVQTGRTYKDFMNSAKQSFQQLTASSIKVEVKNEANVLIAEKMLDSREAATGNVITIYLYGLDAAPITDSRTAAIGVYIHG